MAKTELLGQAKNFYGNLSSKQKIIGVVAIAGVFILIAVLLMLSTTVKSNYGVLFSDLNDKDAGQIVGWLKEKNVDYKLSDDGKTIFVPDDKKYDLRLQLAAEDLPKDSGVGYEIFDKTDLGMSEFEEKVNYKRALEGEISRTIEQSKAIRKARVHIVIPEKALFEKDQKNPTASIVLTFRSRGDKRRVNVHGYQKLVASAVEGMITEDVTVVDNRGNMLSEVPVDRKSTAGMTSAQYEEQKIVEQYLSDKARSMLDNVIGYDNSEVRVNLELDFTKQEETITDYDPERAAVRSQQVVGEKSLSTDTLNYMPVDSLTYSSVNLEKDRANEITNYEIPKTVKTIVGEVGGIERMSVAVVVNSDAVEKLQKEGVEEKPLNDQDIKNLVAKSVGWNSSRDEPIEVKFVPFVSYEKKVEEKPWWSNPLYIKLIALAFVILLASYFLYSLLQSKHLKNRIRIALGLPEKVYVEEEEEKAEEPEEALDEIMLEDDDLKILPAELPEQLLLEGEKPEEEEEEISEAEEELDKEALAARARATVEEGESKEMSEDTMMKVEMKNKVEDFVQSQPSDAVKLVRYLITADIEQSGLKF